MSSDKESKLKVYPQLKSMQRTLLGPGPSMVHPRVYQAMSSPTIGHLDPYFLEVMNGAQELLRYVFQTGNKITLPVSGTGSAAMESTFANFVEPGTRVLICVAGYFGERMAEMARRYGGDVELLQVPWGQAFSPDDIRRALAARPADVVGIVHGETSTGVCQPMEDIPEIVHAGGGLLIVDTVASLGGVPFNVDELDVDICYSGSQKCLSVPPGLGPVTLGARAAERLRKRESKVANWYLDLTMVEKYWGSERTYHHTAPVNAIFGLYEGLRMVYEEGLEARWERHTNCARKLWNGLEEMGLELVVPEALRLAPLTTVRVPSGVDELSVRKSLLRDYNIEIAGGLGAFKGNAWRVGLMGYSAREENVALLLAALKEVLNS